MATWSGIRKKLETEYLAQSLQGHIQYYVTSYSKSPDHEGRAAIRYDGKEIIKGCYWNNWSKAGMFPQDEKYEKRIKVENAYMDDVAIKLGIFDQRCFYNAFAEFDNQDIETSLKSENLIVKIFAVLDRRVGKRRLKIMKETIMDESDTFQEFYAIRVKAEGLLSISVDISHILGNLITVIFDYQILRKPLKILSL